MKHGPGSNDVPLNITGVWETLSPEQCRTLMLMSVQFGTFSSHFSSCTIQWLCHTNLPVGFVQIQREPPPLCVKGSNFELPESTGELSYRCSRV